MRTRGWLVQAFIGGVMLTAAPVLRAQGAQANGSAVRAAGSAAADSGYSGAEGDFIVGRRVYLRSTKTFIGTIIDADANKRFPSDRFPRARMKAVLIKRFDGPLGWIPMESVTRIYVTRTE